MTLITSSEAAKILGFSKRTLYRWEEEGRIRSEREGILRIRVYDRDYIVIVKDILDLNRQEKEHNAKFHKILEESKKHQLEQDYIPGKPLKLMTERDVEASSIAYEQEKAWMAEHQRLLDKILSYPRDILMEVLNLK